LALDASTNSDDNVELQHHGRVIRDTSQVGRRKEGIGEQRDRSRKNGTERIPGEPVSTKQTKAIIFS
jgi:hypothetical protein